jgi:hypothetical protein
MTQLLETAVAFVRKLPPETQDDLARALLQLAGEDQQIVSLTDEERRAIEVSKAAASRGEFAHDEQVRAVWAKHGL